MAAAPAPVCRLCPRASSLRCGRARPLGHAVQAPLQSVEEVDPERSAVGEDVTRRRQNYGEARKKKKTRVAEAFREMSRAKAVCP